jgi:hypothetical protein
MLIFSTQTVAGDINDFFKKITKNPQTKEFIQNTINKKNNTQNIDEGREIMSGLFSVAPLINDSKKQEYINPSFDDMSSARKNKHTRRFAKWITKSICILLKEGFMWWTTKDINPAKLAEYEITGEIDLRILLTMEDGQDATVKQFFLSQFQYANNLSEISEEEKEDLIKNSGAALSGNSPSDSAEN